MNLATVGVLVGIGVGVLKVHPTRMIPIPFHGMGMNLQTGTRKCSRGIVRMLISSYKRGVALVGFML